MRNFAARFVLPSAGRCTRFVCRGLAVLLVCGAVAAPATAQDMEALMRWATVQNVRYHIVGVYDDRAPVTSNTQGWAPVKDRVVIDLVWNVIDEKLVGAPRIANTKTEVGKLSDREPKCTAPTLNGAYEHMELAKVTQSGSVVILEGTRVYPDARTAKVCTSVESSPAKTAPLREELAVPAPTILAMPSQGEITIAADRKSFTFKRGGWTWTYTPVAA